MHLEKHFEFVTWKSNQALKNYVMENLVTVVNFLDWNIEVMFYKFKMPIPFVMEVMVSHLTLLLNFLVVPLCIFIFHMANKKIDTVFFSFCFILCHKSLTKTGLICSHKRAPFLLLESTLRTFKVLLVIIEHRLVTKFLLFNIYQKTLNTRNL